MQRARMQEGVRGASPLQPQLKGKRVLGLGVAAVDFIATVDHFPQPDDKIRSTSFSMLGGGNCANTLTCVRRLGVEAVLATKLGKDANGNSIMSELQADGVSTAFCVCKDGLDSPFTYIIVDDATHTRTCIHTPIGEELLEHEVTPDCLDGVSLLHLDSRNTLAAIKLAKLAHERGIPVVLDAEKDRPHMRELLPLADVVVTNSRYPLVFDSAGFVQGMQALLQLGRARMVISTQGDRGCMALVRGEELTVEEPVKAEPLLVGGERCTVYSCPAVKVEEVVDTTGAGDSFIGGVIYGLLNEWQLDTTLLFASYVASRKIQARGAREGIPRWDEIPEAMRSR